MAQTYDSQPITNVQTLSIQGTLERTSPDVYFFVVLSGAIEVSTGDEMFSLTAQDILMIAPGDNFVSRGGGSNIVLLVNMRAEFFLQGQSQRLGAFICNSKKDNDRDYTNLRRLLSQIALNHYEKDDIANAHQYELSYSLLYYLNKYHYIPRTSPADDKSGKYSNRYSKIMSYLEQNFMNPITLSDLADHVYLTPTYLSRFFKKNLNSNFSVILNKIRLEHAVEELLVTSYPIMTIAYSNGFPGVNAFNKLFKEQFGCTPNAYRKTNTKPILESPPLSTKQISGAEFQIAEQQLKTYAKTDSDDSLRYPIQRVYHIDNVNLYTPTKPIWNSMINLGTGSKLSNYNMQSQIALIQKEIGFRYGRIEGALNNDFIPCLHNDVYNYSDFDRCIESMLSVSLIPFLDLTFKPAVIILTGSNVVYPFSRSGSSSESAQTFLQKISALIRHCINTFGLSEVERWGFEIGYNHDEFLNMIETPAEFAQRFADSYRIIKSYLPRSLVGGPEHNITIGLSVFNEIIDEMDRMQFSPDFISLIAFPYEKAKNPLSDNQFVLSSDPNFISNKVMKIKDKLSSHPNMTQSVYLTVLGVDIKTRNHVNDSCFQATYFAKNTIDLIDKVDILGYFTLSDIGSEYIDAARILFGGPGLLSKHSLKKPGFTALKRFSLCNTQVVQKGSGYLITTNSINSYTIILCNYVHFDDYFCVSNEINMPPDKVYSVFKNPMTHDFSLTMHKVKTGRYKIVTTALNSEYGSLLDEWLRYGILDDLQPRDIRYLQDIVHPQRFARFTDCASGVLELHIQLLPHEMKLIEITREL